MATLLYPLLVVALFCLSTAKEMGLNREKRQASSVCHGVQLAQSGTIQSLERCERSPNNTDTYPNDAEWLFFYQNNQSDTRFVNIEYSISIEYSMTCQYDNITFGNSSDPKAVVLCGYDEGNFSLALGPNDTFTVAFKSDFIITALGFNISWTVDSEPTYSTSNLPRYHNYGGYTNGNYYSAYPYTIDNYPSSTDNYPYYNNYPSSTDNYLYPEQYPQDIETGYMHILPYYPGNQGYSQDNNMAAGVERLKQEMRELISCIMEAESALREVENYSHRSPYDQVYPAYGYGYAGKK